MLADSRAKMIATIIQVIVQAYDYNYRCHFRYMRLHREHKFRIESEHGSTSCT